MRYLGPLLTKPMFDALLAARDAGETAWTGSLDLGRSQDLAALAADAARLMERHAITSVLVTDAHGLLVGVVHIGDLMRAKVI